MGLDSAEVGRPPELFARAYALAADAGLHRVAHAGEEGPPAYVEAALDRLGAERIDHGIRSLEDPSLVARLREEQVPLTVCPLSNVALRSVDRLADHPLRRDARRRPPGHVNSDDPAYFGGYLHDNVTAVSRALGLTAEQRQRLAENSFRASFLPDAEKDRHLAAVAAAAARRPDPLQSGVRPSSPRPSASSAAGRRCGPAPTRPTAGRRPASSPPGSSTQPPIGRPAGPNGPAPGVASSSARSVSPSFTPTSLPNSPMNMFPFTNAPSWPNIGFTSTPAPSGTRARNRSRVSSVGLGIVIGYSGSLCASPPTRKGSVTPA